ncbi:hypothetical protein GGR51DRAFT_526893 [Nemania sp. FL0031]|nr:hypothetical protein GGR51DRAFT_526893 [Nemania sp. FL0031]
MTELHTHLCAPIRCCQKWRPLASSILYRHVVLDVRGLGKFVQTRTICEVTSLTVEMDAIRVVGRYGSDDPLHEACGWMRSLRELGLIIGAMKPGSVSISVFMSVRMPRCVQDGVVSEIASIVKGIPESCSSLEIDVDYSFGG